MDTIPSGLRRSTQEVIEIQLWETYLVQDRTNLRTTLSSYALDRTSLQQPVHASKVRFHFMMYDWKRTIRETLAGHMVPYEIVRVYQTDVVRQLVKKTVYVAEDDVDILFALNTMLEEAGYDVVVSHCGAPMLRNDLNADVFILDKKMPDVDGAEVCRYLKSQPATKDVPVIMISALRNAGVQALKAGANDFLEKPFQMNELLRLVSKHTESGVLS